MVRALIDLGWLDSSKKPWLKDGIAWAEIEQQATGADSPAELDVIKKINELCTFSSPAERAEILADLRWMGLFSDKAASIHENLLDTPSAGLDKLCRFQPGERDLVMLQHKFVVKWQDGSEALELFGDPNGYAGMSKAVGIACGIATQMLLDGFAPFKQPGVLGPYTKDICEPLRVKLEVEDIKLVEKVFKKAA